VTFVKNIDFDLICIEVKRMLKSIQNMKNKKMSEYALKGSTAQCLCRIAQSEQGLNAGEISARLKIDKAQVSRCMAELSERELVFRNTGEGKQYRQRYCLTEKGARVAADIARTSLDVRDQIGKGITEEDADAFYRVLEIMCRNSQEI
jgi:DNA-binding MarR family transcriptional regulator